MGAYHVSRGGRQLGVYGESEAREYFAQGRIGPGDMVWQEGMAAGGLPASEVFGNGPQQADDAGLPPPPPPSPPPAAPVVTAEPMPASPPAFRPDPSSATGPVPPKLHWAVVLLLTLVTLGIFYIVWTFVQAAWVKKIDPESNAMRLMVIYVILVVIGQVMSDASGEGTGGAAMGTLLVLAGSVVSVLGFFSIRRSMLDYYNKVEPIGLRLSGALTFFLSAFYLQHHMSRIAKWKETGELPPQSRG